MVLNNSPVFLLNCYFQPSLDQTYLFNKLDQMLFSFRAYNLLILGDFNSRSTLWGDSLTNESGVMLSELVMKHSLFIYNPKHCGPTFSSHLGCSVIDLTLSNFRDFFVSGWRVDRDCVVLSDHFLISFSIQSKPAKTDITNPEPSALGRRNFLNFSAARWNDIKHFINTKEFKLKFLACFDVGFPDRSLTLFHNLIDDIIERFIPLRTTSKFNYWWSPKLTQLKANVRAGFRKFVKTHSRSDHLAYKRARNAYVSSIKSHKCNWILSNDLHDLRSGKSPWGSSFKQFFGKLKSHAFPAIEGLGPHCTLDSLTKLLNDAFPDDLMSSDDDYHSALRAQFLNFSFSYVSDSDDITLSEISRAVDRLRPGKSAGLDGIKSCFWKKFHSFNTNFLVYLFNFCFRLGHFPLIWISASITFIPKSTGTSLRPISILPSLGKIYEHILNIRLRAHAESKGLIGDYQFGFIPGKSTLHAFNCFQCSYQEFSSRNYVLAAFLDISKAFDSVWWPGIFDILLRRECPAPLLAAVHNFFKDRIVSLKFGSLSVSKRLSLGCPQGSLISPLLWNIFFNSIFDIPVHKFMRVIAYADDVSVIVSHYSQSLCVILLNDFMSRLSVWSCEKRISFSTSKSVILVLCGALSWSPTVFLNDVALEVVTEYKFLGIIVSKNLRFHKHIIYKTQRGEKHALMFFRLLRSNKALTIVNMIRIYKSVIIPSLSYGVSFWFRTASLPFYARHFISLQRKCLLSISGCLRTTSSVALDIIVGILPIMIRLDALHAREGLRIVGSSHFGGNYFTNTNTRIHVFDSFCVPSVVSKLEFKNLIDGVSLSLWDSQWASSISGRFTFKFFNSIQSRISRPWICSRGPLARFLSGHSICEEYFDRFNISKGRLCPCDSPSRGLLHDLFDCIHFSHYNFFFAGCDPSVLTAEPYYHFLLEFSRVRELRRRSQLHNC